MFRSVFDLKLFIESTLLDLYLKDTSKLRTQTKCTISLCTLFLIELLPIPFTGIYSIYAIRKRPDWIPRVVQRLYADKPVDLDNPVEELSVEGHDFMKSRRNCTIAIISLFVVDVIVPVIVPLGIYIARKRPNWFKNVTRRLYADRIDDILLAMDAPAETDPSMKKKFLGFRFWNKQRA